MGLVRGDEKFGCRFNTLCECLHLQQLNVGYSPASAKISIGQRRLAFYEPTVAYRTVSVRQSVNTFRQRLGAYLFETVMNTGRRSVAFLRFWLHLQ